jgi:predicted nucleic acid-binding protein
LAVEGPTYLLDKSALVRVRYPGVDAVITPLMRAGQIATCGIIDLEVLYSSRTPDEYESVWMHRHRDYRQLALTQPAVERALHVQRTLAAGSQHRSVGLSDLLIAATAELNDAVMLHYDQDYDVIADVTGQRAVWVVPRGTVP